MGQGLAGGVCDTVIDTNGSTTGMLLSRHSTGSMWSRRRRRGCGFGDSFLVSCVGA